MTSVLGLVLISMSACLMPKSVPQGLGATPEGHPVEVEHQQRWQRKVDKLPFREAHLHTRRTLHGTVGGGLEGGPVVDSLRVGRSRVSRVLAHRGGASADLGGANKTVGRSNARGRPVFSRIGGIREGEARRRRWGSSPSGRSTEVCSGFLRTGRLRGGAGRRRRRAGSSISSMERTPSSEGRPGSVGRRQRRAAVRRRRTGSARAQGRYVGRAQCYRTTGAPVCRGRRRRRCHPSERNFKLFAAVFRDVSSRRCPGP